MQKIIKHMRLSEWLQVVLVFMLSVLQVGFDLMVPQYMRHITIYAQTPGSTIGQIVTAGGFMLLFALGSLICVVVVSFFASKVSAALSMRLRGMVFSKVGDFSMEEFSRYSASSLISRSTNDISQIQRFAVSFLRMLLKAPILAIGGIIGITRSGAAWMTAALVAFGAVLSVVVCVMIFVVPQFKKMQRLVDELNRTLRESLAGRFVLRAYNAESFHEEKFESANSGFTSADKRTNRAMAVMGPVMSLGTNGALIAVYIIGALMINAAGHAQALDIFSAMVVMALYLSLVFSAIKFIIKVVPTIPRAAVSAGRIAEILEAEPVIKEGTLTQGAAGNLGEVEFKNVSFKYPGASGYALEALSFHAKRGETVAVIGSTGSGKTTLVNLIMRFFDAAGGQVLVNGVDVKQYRLQSLYNKIGYVPQKSVLFKGTLCSNITYGKSGRGQYSSADAERAIQIAQAEEFISKLEEGSGAAVSQRGSNFSGGQKQRISIARAICRRPEILIFDDSFSALDYKTDRELRSALKAECSAATKIIISQRIGTIMDADQIIVLDGGKIAEAGTHTELLRSCQVYREIAMSQQQLGQEELVS